MKVISSYLDSHFRENFIINEVGMKLIPDHDSQIRKSLVHLTAKAPLFSTTQLNFTNLGDKVEGELIVNGSYRYFNRKAVGQSPLAIFKKLKRDFEKEFSQDQKQSFLHKNFGFAFATENKQMTGGLAS